MSETVRVVCLFILLLLSGFFAGAVVLLSPSPMPMGNAQLLTASIALFSGSGITLVRLLATGRRSEPSGKPGRKKIDPKKPDPENAPSLEAPAPEVLPSETKKIRTERHA